MKLLKFQFISLLGVWAFLIGLSLAPIFLSAAKAQTDTAGDNISAALADLSQAIGQEITTKEQAKAICDQEAYFVACAEIGKKHSLYTPEEAQQVDLIIEELKGQTIQELQACKDETCLLEVATSLAERISNKNPALAEQIELTPEKIDKKKQVATVVEEAAREIGVTFKECRQMDPDTAPVELLRACARLAKNERVQQFIPEELKLKTRTNNIGNDLELTAAIRAGEGPQPCVEKGITNPDECGLEFTRALEAGDQRKIEQFKNFARKFGFSESEIDQTAQGFRRQVDLIKGRIEPFTTHDGRVLFDPAQIGRYLEEQGRQGNVEAVKKGMDFLIARGFIRPEEKEFALKMVEQIKEAGKPVDFDACRRNPRACEEFVPAEFRQRFDVMEQIRKIMFEEMNKEGVPDPALCEDPAYGEGCLAASKRALPRLEALAGDIPEAQAIIQEIKSHIKEGELGFEARRRAQEAFNREGGKITIGDQVFTSFEEADRFCRLNGEVCLAEAAKKGFINSDFAADKFEKAFERKFEFQFGPQPPEGPFPPFVDSFGPPEFGFPGQPTGETSSPGQPPFGVYPQQGPFGAPPAGFDKEEALNKFKAWLENPIGPPPIVNFSPPPFELPPGGPAGGAPGGSGSYPGSPGQPYPGPYPQPYPQPSPYPGSSEPVCPDEQEPPACPAGFTYYTSYTYNGCAVFSPCVQESVNQGSLPYTFITGRTVYTYDEAKRYCFNNPPGSGAGIADECENKFGIKFAIETPEPIPYPQPTPYPEPAPTPSCPEGQNWDPTRGQCTINCGQFADESSCGASGACTWDASLQVCYPRGGAAPVPGPEPYPYPAPPQQSNWTDHTWTFSDGQTEHSFILNRTDQEYLDYIASIEDQCRQIPRSQFYWKQYAGDDRPENWQNFGIPECSGTANLPACPSGEVWDPALGYCVGAQPPSSGLCNFNSVCDPDENNSSCPSDCGSTYCGEGWQPYKFGNTDSCIRTGVTCPDTSSWINSCPNGPFNWNYDGCPTGCSTAYPGTGCGQYSDQASCTNASGCQWDAAGNYCYQDTYSYPGDENSCPGFAYSQWDQNGVRYCQLNNARSCQYNYPEYLDQNTYATENCPTESTTGTSNCGNYICDAGETYSSCPSDCGGTTACNFDGVCDIGESVGSCPADCGSVPSGGGCLSYTDEASCVNAACVWYAGHYDGTHCDDAAHGQADTTACNNNGICDYGESSASCPADCGTTSTGYCGDYVCDSNENQTSCPSDCGTPTTGYCGDNVCDPALSEDSNSCPVDCGTSTGDPATECTNSGGTWDGTTCIMPPTTGYCGDNVCDPALSEDSNSCPVDCGQPTGYCGDGVCDGSLYEDSYNCSTDCGTPPTTDPAVECANSGGVWDPAANFCDFGPPPASDPAVECANSGGTWNPDTNTCEFASLGIKNFFASIIEAILKLFR